MSVKHVRCMGPDLVKEKLSDQVDTPVTVVLHEGTHVSGLLTKLYEDSCVIIDRRVHKSVEHGSGGRGRRPNCSEHQVYLFFHQICDVTDELGEEIEE